MTGFVQQRLAAFDGLVTAIQQIEAQHLNQQVFRWTRAARAQELYAMSLQELRNILAFYRAMGGAA